ncbi:MAG: phosphate ABC transporter substrate-binding/OmpA family protein [Pseudomonadota bacterium]
MIRSLLVAVVAAGPAAAQDVTLTSRDGAIEVSGTLLTFDGEFYRVDSAFGALTIAADGVACTGPGCPDLSDFVAEARLVGATVLAETLLPALIEAFALDRGFDLEIEIVDDTTRIYTLARADQTIAARFTLTAATSEDGFLALLNRDADLALTLREPLDLEIRAAQSAEVGDLSLARRARIVALDALVPIVARANPVDRITPEGLAGVYTGMIGSWADLGGPDAPITLHLPADASGLAQDFSARVLAGSILPLAGDIVRHDDPRDLAEAVARDPFAIGIATLSSIGNARALALSGSCGFAISATPETLKSEDYPLTAPLFVYTPARRLPPLVRDFLDFFETARAERVVRRAGYVSQEIMRAGLSDQGERLANAVLAAGDEVDLDDLQRMIARMTGTARLSPTFRFAGGSTDLDTPSLSSLSRLATAIEQGEFDGRTLIFVGFSDSAGPAAANLRLSRNRADAVRQAVIEAAGAADLDRVRFRVAGFGEALPLACDDSDWGAGINRRVEVWLD